jgi:hypothetical protein
MARGLVNSSKAGDVVLDLFGGSGSTLETTQLSGEVPMVASDLWPLVSLPILTDIARLPGWKHPNSGAPRSLGTSTV